MNRRGFLGAILAAGLAPAIVRSASLMKMVPTESGLLVPVFYGKLGSYENVRIIVSSPEAVKVYSAALFGAVGDGVTDDTAAIQAAVNAAANAPLDSGARILGQILGDE